MSPHTFLRCVASALVALAILAGVSACQITKNRFNVDNTLCSDAEYQHIEKHIRTSDTQGHGPDIGSDEWQSVVEFKLGLRGAPDVPDRGTKQWCETIWQKFKASADSAVTD